MDYEQKVNEIITHFGGFFFDLEGKDLETALREVLPKETSIANMTICFDQIGLSGVTSICVPYINKDKAYENLHVLVGWICPYEEMLIYLQKEVEGMVFEW